MLEVHIYIIFLSLYIFKKLSFNLVSTCIVHLISQLFNSIFTKLDKIYSDLITSKSSIF